MARFQPGDATVVVEGVKTPVVDTDAANKAYVDASAGGGDNITASGGLQRVEDDISIATDGVTSDKIATNAVTSDAINADAVTSAKIATNAVTSDAIAQHAVTDFEIAPGAIDEVRLNVTNDPTAGQILSAAGSNDQFTWVDQSSGGNAVAAGEFISVTTANDTDTVAVAQVYDPFNAEGFSFITSGTPTDGQFTWDVDSGSLVLEPTNPESAEDINLNIRPGMTMRMVKTNSLGTIETAWYGIRTSAEDLGTYLALLTPDDDNHRDSFFTAPALGTDTYVFDVLQLQTGGSTRHVQVGWLENVDDTAPNTGEALIWNGGQSEWQPTETVNTITNGGHITPGTNADGSVSLTFDEKYDLWNGKNDWTQITSGTPTGDNFLYDAGTQTITVPSLAGREVLEILLDARSGMAVHIRQENTTSTPSGFQSGFYQILAINATATPEQVVIRMLPDSSDIFDEVEGNTYQYELSILQFVTGGTLDNLTLTGLSDVDVSTPPTDGQVLAYELSSGTFIPADNAGGGGSTPDYNNATYGALKVPNVSYTYTTETSPVNEGEVSISAVDSPDTGYSLLFRRADVDAKALQGIRYIQIGFGSPIAFATYAVVTTSFVNFADPLLVDITVIDGPLAGNDLLASLPLDETALSINATSNEFENADLGDLPDVDFSTAPTDGQVLAYELSSDTWKPSSSGGGGGDLGDLGDVNTSGVQDGFVLRYDSDNLNYRVHSVGDTNRAFGGLDVDMDTGFTVPAATGFHAVGLGTDAVASGIEAIAIGAETDATAQATIAIGNEAQATFASASALGDGAQAVHTNSTAIGQGAITTEVDEVRLGDGNAHATVHPDVAGNESDNNQLVSKRWVNNQISDASRVISSTANALENLTIVTDSTPWDDFRIVPVDALDDPSLEVHMYEFDASQPQYIFYPGFMSNSSFGTGAGLTTGTIPTFFEEVTDIGNEAEVTNAGGEAVTSLGFKYIGHDSATVWQAVSHVYTFQFQWIYPAGNSDGAQNPPDVTSSLELVRLKPSSSDTYNMATSATVIASSPTSFHNAGQLNPGETETFTGSYEFAQQTLADGVSNVENGDVFAYRMKVRYKGNGFDGETNVRLAITESETTNFVPQIGIRHVGRDYSLTLENSGDLMWEDHNLTLDTLLLIENTGDGPEIPAATLGLVGGEGISVTSKTINVNLQNLNSGLEFDTAGDLRVDAGDGLELDSTGVTIDLDGANDTSGLTVGTNGLSVKLSDNSAMSLESDGLQVRTLRANGTTIDTSDSPPALGIAFDTETNNPLGITGSGTGAGLSLNIDEDGPLSKTTNGLDVVLEVQGGLSIGSLSSGIEIDLQDGSGLQTNASGLSINVASSGGLGFDVDGAFYILTDPLINGPLSLSANGLKWDADLTELNDVTITGTPTDGQILEYDSATSMWVNSTLSGNHTFTAGTGLAFNSDSTVLNWASTLSGLTDVSLVAPNNLDVLTWNGTDWAGAAPGASFTAGEGLSFNSDNSVLNITANIFEYSRLGFTDGDAEPDVVAESTRFIAIGTGGSVGGASSISIGTNAQALLGGSTALGLSARAEGATSTSVGGGSRAMATDSSAFGKSALASGSSSIALGDEANATATQASALGPDSTASGARSTALGRNTNASGTDAVAVGNNSTSGGTNAISMGSGANGTGDRSVIIGSAALGNAHPLGIAIGERATVNATRGIAIGSSSNSASANADLCRADGGNSVAIGRAARADGDGSIAFGDDTRALTTSTIAIGDGAQVTLAATGSTAIGASASATIANSTVLGNGASHRVFAGSRELTPSSQTTADFNDITCSVNNDFFNGGAFNPNTTASEALSYTTIGDLVMGRFEYILSPTSTSPFEEGDRWTINSTSTAMLDCFGFDVGTRTLPLGTFVIGGDAYNQAGMGDFWLHPDTTTSVIRMSFRIRSAIGTLPTRVNPIRCQFQLAKF